MKKLTSFLMAMLLVLSLPVAASASETVDTVREMIDALPTVEQFKAMNEEQQLDAYNRTQAAFDAYEALTEEEQNALEGAEETFEALFGYYNTLIAPAEEPQAPENDTAANVLATALAALLVMFLMKGFFRKKM